MRVKFLVDGLFDLDRPYHLLLTAGSGIDRLYYTPSKVPIPLNLEDWEQSNRNRIYK